MNERKITSFTFISLDGFYKDKAGNINWHRHGPEESEYSAKSLEPGNILLFGRVTYEMMAGWWPSPAARQQLPAVASGMNNAEKIVFSKTMETAEWNNSRIINQDIIGEMKKLKQAAGKNMTLLGSGTILTQFAEAGLIDHYQIMIDPVAIGTGESIFTRLTKPLDLQLTNSRIFKSGTILLDYIPKN